MHCLLPRIREVRAQFATPCCAFANASDSVRHADSRISREFHMNSYTIPFVILHLSFCGRLGGGAGGGHARVAEAGGGGGGGGSPPVKQAPRGRAAGAGGGAAGNGGGTGAGPSPGAGPQTQAEGGRARAAAGRADGRGGGKGRGGGVGTKYLMAGSQAWKARAERVKGELSAVASTAPRPFAKRHYGVAVPVEVPDPWAAGG